MLMSRSSIALSLGEEHLKNLKRFLCQNGGKVDSLDSFRILETYLTKVSNSRCPEVANFGSNLREVNFSLPASAHSGTNLCNSNDLNGMANSSSQQNLLYKNGIWLGNSYFSNVGVCHMYQSGSTANRESSSQVNVLIHFSFI
ncbi:hypothetical protein DITRI_Ditri04bG0022300 [Diplodiscus trichospermus]